MADCYLALESCETNNLKSKASRNNTQPHLLLQILPNTRVYLQGFVI